MEHMDPYIGKMLDNRYEILERIGTGRHGRWCTRPSATG